jgi:hypothetical protein
MILSPSLMFEESQRQSLDENSSETRLVCIFGASDSRTIILGWNITIRISGGLLGVEANKDAFVDERTLQLSQIWSNTSDIIIPSQIVIYNAWH